MQSQLEPLSTETAANGGVLCRLFRSRAGNVLPVMAMAIIPLAGLIGGSVDVSRMYLTKARLQQACDAGALAGRKVMGSNTWAYNSNAANTAALQYFDVNFANGAYGTTGRTRTYSETAGKVTGTASAVVPMTIMRVFNQPSQTISVVCDAEMRLPNTDIMFVLDTTGSMDGILSGDTQSKITGLKFAVKCFYEVVAKLDTNAACPGTAPSGGTSGVQIRFGFMPYATNVNVGRLLPTSFFANSWSYQTRKRRATPASYNTTNTDGTWSNGAWSSWSNWVDHSYVDGDRENQCNLPATTTTVGTTTSTIGTPSTDGYGTITTPTVQTRVVTETEYQKIFTPSGGGGNPRGSCDINKRTRTRTETRTNTQVQTPVYNWDYGYYPLDISGLKNNTTWNNSVTLPIGIVSGQRGRDKIVTWDGCIEERPTRKLTNYSPIPSDAYDLQIDLMPTSGDSNSLWGPALPDALSIRSTYAEQTDRTEDWTKDSNGGIAYECPTQAKKLQEWTASTLQTYVDSIGTGGNTYHDIGLIWGARFISPTGIFATENATTPQGGEIERHLIFMTDGETCTMPSNYQAYGYSFYDRRQSDTAPAYDTACPGSSWTTSSSLLNDQVNARFSAMCTAIKNQNITLWVVYYGTTDAGTTTRMTNCATSGRFYNAGNTATLISTFRSIAEQISALRLTR